jgi:hypothetical protein
MTETPKPERLNQEGLAEFAARSGGRRSGEALEHGELHPMSAADQLP